MSTLTNIDKLKLEKIFQSASGAGYILDFSDRTFQDFVLTSTGKGIGSETYAVNGVSKANRLRTFWSIESDPIVGKLTAEMLEYWKTQKLLKAELINEHEQALYDESMKIVERLAGKNISKTTDEMNTYDYDIAISFAGEDRTVAEAIANKLKTQGVRVFYDKFEEANLWGEDLYVHLDEVYSKKARFCIMLLSEHYAKKAWTNHERQSAQARAFKESEAYILPVKIDETSIPGIRDTVGYISLKNKSVDDVVETTLVKLGRMPAGMSASATGVKAVTPKPFIPLPQVKKDFTERDRDVFIKKSFTTIHEFFQEGIKQLNELTDVEADLDVVTSVKFMCKVYLQGKLKSSCTIWIGSQFSSSGINYANQANPDAGHSLNDSLTIDANNAALYLKPLMDFSGSAPRKNMDATAAAEYYWGKLIEPLNR